MSNLRTVLAGGAAAALLFGAAAAAAVPVLWSGNGHYYEAIGGGTSWNDALVQAAAAPPIEGFGSHLATITSAAEDNFVFNILTSNIAWFAGTDSETEGVWKWAAGPEQGRIFFGPGAEPGAYTNWNPGEPFASGDVTLGNSAGTFRNWSANNASSRANYIIEWSPLSAVPEPASWVLIVVGFGLVGARLRRRPVPIVAV